MTEQAFNDGISWLGKYHSRQLSPEAKAIYWHDFKDVSDLAFARAIEESCRKSRPGLFPTIADLWNLLAGHWERAWQQTKNQENKKPLSRPAGANPKVRAMLGLLDKRMAGQITQQELEARVNELSKTG